jgi:ABC-type multidrug transport system fused ATPase/permease subunit
VAILFFLAPKLTAGLVIAIPVVVLPIVWFGRRLRAESRSSQDRIADIGAMVAEVLGAARIAGLQPGNARERPLCRRCGTQLWHRAAPHRAPDQRGDAAGDGRWCC